MYANRRNLRVLKEIWVEKHDSEYLLTSDFRLEVEIWLFRTCAMHSAIIIGTSVRSLWTWLWGRYHVPQNVFLVYTVLNLHCLIISTYSVFLNFTMADHLSNALSITVCVRMVFSTGRYTALAL